MKSLILENRENRKIEGVQIYNMLSIQVLQLSKARKTGSGGFRTGSGGFQMRSGGFQSGSGGFPTGLNALRILPAQSIGPEAGQPLAWARGRSSEQRHGRDGRATLEIHFALDLRKRNLSGRYRECGRRTRRHECQK
jgi:hypothetical protein